MNLRMVVPFVLSMFFVLTACGQMGDKSKRESPPATAEQTINGTHITIDYSQPAVKKRQIYGGLVPYDKIWRTGANEATTFTTTKDIMVNDTKLPAGKYSLFTIPGKDEWTIIFNSVWDQWGAYKYDSSKDVIRIKAKPEEHDFTESMTFSINGDGTVNLDWENTRVSFQIGTPS